MADLEDPDVFDYLDYRAFLRDYYLAKKDRRGLSYRGFSKRAGLSSPNYLKLVIDGDRNLSLSMARRFATAAGLKGDHAAFFVELTRFNQAKSAEDRDTSYGRLTRFQRYRQAKPLDLLHAEYHRNWYLPAIRELAARKDFRDDACWIADQLIPAISSEEAQHALDTLLELKLLVRTARGRVVQGEQLLSTGPETRGLHIRHYHRMMMAHAADSIDRIPAQDRDISSLTLCLGKSGLERLKQRIVRFRRELLELSALEEEPGQVVQLNFQLFPLSRPPAEDER